MAIANVNNFEFVVEYSADVAHNKAAKPVIIHHTGKITIISFGVNITRKVQKFLENPLRLLSSYMFLLLAVKD